MKSERVMWKFFRKHSTDMLNNNYTFITINIVAVLHFWTIFIPIFDSFIDVSHGQRFWLLEMVVLFKLLVIYNGVIPV
ncbi:MAG: hypothetical protein ACEY3M_08390, partial [Wolbachia sp.]